MKHRHRRRGPVHVQVKISPELQDVLLQLKPAFELEFRERFGRNLRPDDPVFWSRARSGAFPVPMTEEEIEQVVDEHLDERFYAMLAEDETAREEFMAMEREMERFAGMTEDQFRKLFREKFGREWNKHEPILSARSEEEFEFVMGYTCSRLLLSGSDIPLTTTVQ